MLGLLCHRLLKPLIKKRWLITMMMTVKSSWASPIATGLSARKAGAGQPHIMCPMDRYISSARNTSELNRRRLRAGVS